MADIDVKDAKIIGYLVLADPGEHHNKDYWVYRMQDGRVVVRYGRVGETHQAKDYGPMSDSFIESKLNEKRGKGYRDVDLATQPAPQAASIAAPPDLIELVTFVEREAGRAVATYSTARIDQFSTGQLSAGRQVLVQLRDAQSRGEQEQLVKQYLNVIPTRIPFHQLSTQAVTDWMLGDLGNHFNALDQLLANLASYQATSQGVVTPFAGLPCEVERMHAGEADHDQLWTLVKATMHAGSSVHSMYRIRIHPDAEDYDADTVGKSNVATLFHGTASANIQKIFGMSLIIPAMAANGSRLGRGIYFADKAARSQNYAGSNTCNWKALFACDVALGRMKVEPGSANYTAAPHGYDSVHGTQSWSGMDEFVVYRRQQKAVRALVIFN